MKTDLFENIDEENRSAQAAGPVTCLGITFANDNERRTYFTEKLREKLKDSEFRKVEGFPIGSDEKILNLSDPPYYTACPNPWIADFIAEWEAQKPEQSESYLYHREPFAADVSEGKNDPIYNAHSYHTKVPHKAIMRYILHYTQPGDIVFDGFCGTGMTGVAAQITNRQSILCDLSPLATFLSSNFCATTTAFQFSRAINRVLDRVNLEVDSLYRKDKGFRDFTIYSAVVECDNCQFQFDQWSECFDKETKQVSSDLKCPECKFHINSKTLKHVKTTTFDPILGKMIGTKKRIQRFSKIREGSGTSELWMTEDGNSYDEYSGDILQHNISTVEIPKMYESHFKRNLAAEGVTHFHHFYSPRNLLACLRLWDIINEAGPLFKFGFLNTSWHATIMRRYNAGGGHRPKTNTLYIPALSSEGRVSKIYENKIADITRFLSSKGGSSYKPAISTSSASSMNGLPNDSVDYIFIDPPFGSNIMYSDLNFIWESWLGVRTNTKDEAIENHIQEKSIETYRTLMRSCFSEFYRILKPGRWMTVEFSNTNASIWNSIQNALSEAGFIVANVSSLDKQQRSINSYTSTTSVKQDLVISAYKPNGGFEGRFQNEAQTEDGVWDFVRTHLNYLPITKRQGELFQFIPERDPRILFDQVVAYYVRKGFLIPIATSQEFQAGLAQLFIERDGMYFLPDQVAEYDRAKMLSGGINETIEMFVKDEESMIHWLRKLIKEKPQTFSDINPQFMQQLGGWSKSETQLDLRELLIQNFLPYDGNGPVPEQIHAYLSSNWKELRNLPKDDPGLRAKARDRWYMPDPNKAGDLEKLREKALVKEFDTYCQEKKKLKIFRLEAVRAGFKKAWANRDYAVIVAVADKIPHGVLEEDPKLLMWYDQATTRMGGEA
ncbi:DNA methyltransferase [Agrobacterium rosae]|uniref:site-specific DNA-methyltransferase (adenine-specific) n=1 Tax=Agrobacterium rosae TaxID=1972867 RepID=A0A1R3U1X3_9HYPH|nr:DNA methyltransferase [Agrobacterium rosae]SCX35216.1 putative methyltransferase [Agrobacterium rosae]